MDMFKKNGHSVIDCTNDVASSVSNNLKEICRLANAQPLDLFISIHFNAGKGQGCETFTYGSSDNGYANRVNSALACLGFKNRGIKDGSNLYVIKNTKAKAILVEVCFVDTGTDASLYEKLGAERVAKALYEGITGQANKSEDDVIMSTPKTVYSLNDVHVQVLDVNNFKLKQVSKCKQNINEVNYANAGFFANMSGGNTIPVGNLVIDGNVITDAKLQADWLNTAGKKLTTLVIHNDNNAEFVVTDDMNSISDVKYAISGIPIIHNGYKVTMDDIKGEGYFGSELYDTWHGFVGIRDGRLVYVASQLDFELMVYLLEVLGIKDAIKLDGGGSFILHNGNFEIATNENRRIDNILVWEG